LKVDKAFATLQQSCTLKLSFYKNLPTNYLHLRSPVFCPALFRFVISNRLRFSKAFVRKTLWTDPFIDKIAHHSFCPVV
jgi:hypothetical protein